MRTISTDAYLEVSQETALPSGNCGLVWDSETQARTKPHAGEIHDPVGTLGRGTSISPDIRRLPEAGTILFQSPHK